MYLSNRWLGQLNFLQNSAPCHAPSAWDAECVGAFKFVSDDSQLFKFLAGICDAYTLQLIDT